MASYYCSIVRRSISRKITAGAACNSMLGAPRRRTMCSSSSSSFISLNNNVRTSSSPWLMLPPELQGNISNNNNKSNMDDLFMFYNLADNKLINLTPTTSIKTFMGSDNINNIEFVSSSHGWLSLFNPRNNDLYIYNPISGRHIKLPSIHKLDIPEHNLNLGLGCVRKLITSSSGENDKDFRVLMSYGPLQRLAFCSLTSSNAHWIPIGDQEEKEEDGEDRYPRMYEDFVYSSKTKLFYCISLFEEDLEGWDLRDIRSPKLIPMDISAEVGGYKEVVQETKFLVVDDESGDLYLVRRQVAPVLDGGLSESLENDDDLSDLPYQTVGFDVYKYDPMRRVLVPMDKGSLDGLAFFIGNNHSFAMRSSGSSEFTGLMKPNCIYFTDVYSLIPHKSENLPHGGHDIGIFNYEDGSISSCYYPRHRVQRIVPAPMWFTPTCPAPQQS